MNLAPGMTTPGDEQPQAVAPNGERIGSAPRVGTTVFTATDTAAERAYLDDLYGEALVVEGIGPGNEVTHRRSAAVGFAVDEISIRHRARVVARPRSGVMIGTALDATVHFGGGPETHPGDSVLTDERRNWSAVVDTATIQVITVEPWLLRKAADEQLYSHADPLKALLPHPSTAAFGEIWKHTVDYVVQTMAAGAPRPLIDASGQVLAAAVLSCFGRPDAPTVPAAQDPALPLSLRRAMAFIAASARDEVGVQEIAGAVHLSPRAVQYLFRKHLGETPTEHLRRVRLQRAHLDLVAGHHSTTTVSEVARRWGFGHTGRFAVLYRETYGVSPHMTLRG